MSSFASKHLNMLEPLGRAPTLALHEMGLQLLNFLWWQSFCSGLISVGGMPVKRRSTGSAGAPAKRAKGSEQPFWVQAGSLPMCVFHSQCDKIVLEH